jgi:hypothetical protein
VTIAASHFQRGRGSCHALPAPPIGSCRVGASAGRWLIFWTQGRTGTILGSLMRPGFKPRAQNHSRAAFWGRRWQILCSARERALIVSACMFHGMGVAQFTVFIFLETILDFYCWFFWVSSIRGFLCFLFSGSFTIIYLFFPFSFLFSFSPFFEHFSTLNNF